jgi:pantoate--beta-alanine ligase
MEVLRSPAEMRAWRVTAQGQVGLVPTMGALHEGHLSLVRRCVAENDVATASLFVNPTQFAPGEDFERYPRDEARDLAMFESAGVRAVYAPDARSMYPEGFQTAVQVRRVTQPLEGAARPGHFDGVTTVVAKLLNSVQPHRAYFGRKDAHQLRVIRQMVRDLDMAVEVVPCDIMREADGLAMSSRNVYLSPEERAAAPVIHRALSEMKERHRAGERGAGVLRELVLERIGNERLAEIEYVSVADDGSLEELEEVIEGAALVSVAVRFGRTRLIDNVELGG